MSELTITSIESVSKLLMMMAVGFIGTKAGIITKEINSALTTVLLKIVLPIMLFSSYFVEYNKEKSLGLLQCALVCIIVYLITIAVASLVVSKKNNPDYGIDRASSVMGNCGFLGIPLIQFMLGSEAVIYMTGYITINNLVAWTYGKQSVTNDFNLKSFVKACFGPSNIAVYLGLILYFSQIKLPGLVTDVLSTVGSTNSVLAMIVAGSTIARSDIFSSLKDIKFYVPLVIKLIIQALITIPVLKLLGITGEVALICFIAGATPIAAVINMFAVQEGKNYARASALFALSTILFMLTLPLMITIYQLF